MNSITIFTELHWAVLRPELKFYLNGNLLAPSLEIVEHTNYIEKVIYSISVDRYESDNTLSIQLENKTDNLITPESDHWVDIKNILVDGISADWVLLEHSCFKHSMSPEWVDQMKKNGYDIASEYRPGSEMRLNGQCLFTFSNPFLIEKILMEYNK